MKVLLIDQIAKINYKYSFSLANALRENGIDISLAIDQKKEEENCFSVKYNLFNTDEKSVSKLLKLKNYVSSYKEIERIIRKEKIEIIQSQWFSFSPLDFFFLKRIKKKNRVRYVATVHDILPFHQMFYDFFFHKRLYKLADKIILQAESNIERFAQIFPESSNKTILIPHGHFLDYCSEFSKNDSRKKLNIPIDKTVFLFFGQIKKVKGLDVLLQALAELKNKGCKDFLLVIAGSIQNVDFDEYNSIIQQNDLEDFVKLDIKYIPDDDIKYYFSSCDVCVLPYSDVYQSGVIQLVYGYKKPVVATKLPAFTQFVIEDKTGYVAEVNNVTSLANSMEKAINDSNDWNEKGLRGYSLVKEKLDWNKIAKTMISECYEK